jgi:hypothetical protein
MLKNAYQSDGNGGVMAVQIEVDEVISISKLELKNRLKSIGKYEMASVALASLDSDKQDDWTLATCASSDNHDLLALLGAIGITDITTIFY